MLVAFIRVHLYPEYMCGRVEAARHCPYFLACSLLLVPAKVGLAILAAVMASTASVWSVTATTVPHSLAQWQKPAKNKIEKFVKLTDHACACNSLTNFEYEVHAIIGNVNQSAEICLERLVKSHLK